MDEKSLPGAAPRAVGSLACPTSETSAPPTSPSSGDDAPFGFPKSRRLLRRPDFRKVYDTGSRTGTALFTVFYLRRDSAGGPRFGLTTPRAVGKAVLRNRIKRRMREAIRLESAGCHQPVDVIFHPRRSVADVDFAVLRRGVAEMLKRCGTF